MEMTVNAYPRLAATLAESPIVPKGDYDYFVHPLSDGIPPVDAALLREAADGLVRHLGPVLPDVNLLVTAEAMGLPLVAAITLATGIPYVTARKRAYGLPHEKILEQRTGYGHATLYLNAIPEGARVAIIDDVVSTGGTLRALVHGVRARGADVLAVAAVFSKDPDLAHFAREFGCPVSALVSCRVVRGGTAKRVEVLGTDLFG